MLAQYSFVDVMVFIIYALILVISGWWVNRSVNSSRDFFLAGKQMPMWVVAISILATSQSAATFLGGPDKGYRGNLTYLATNIGAFIAGLEYVSDARAIVTGKPAEAFFEVALNFLGVCSAGALLVGDDIQSDIGGAQAAGIKAALVQTGKYREDLVERSGIQPDFLLSSIADIPSLLAGR